MKFTLEEWKMIYSAVKIKARNVKEEMDTTSNSETREAYRKNYCTLTAIILKIENEEI
jgi:hypothetical protein